jgi:hypothetical protein
MKGDVRGMASKPKAISRGDWLSRREEARKNVPGSLLMILREGAHIAGESKRERVNQGKKARSRERS